MKDPQDQLSKEKTKLQHSADNMAPFAFKKSDLGTGLNGMVTS